MTINSHGTKWAGQTYFDRERGTVSVHFEDDKGVLVELWFETRSDAIRSLSGALVSVAHGPREGSAFGGIVS